jgi:hypothetical protein
MNTASRHSGSGISFRRHVAPFAPVALALAMNIGERAGVSGGVARGVQFFEPVCALPFTGVRNPLIDDHCGIDGRSSKPADQAENRAKNNFCAATQLPRVITYNELLDMQTKSGSIPKNLPDRTALQNMGEGQYVSYIAFIKEAHYSDVGKGEAVNCNIPGNATNDIHIVLMKDADDNEECHSTTAEMSPHYRPPDWTPENLLSVSKGHPVRIWGQLFFDGSHAPCSGTSRPKPNRASLWEIHPVYSVEVCTQTTIAECQGASADWTPLSQLLSSEQQ